MFVMRLMRDVITNVMKEGGGRQQRAAMTIEVGSQLRSRKVVIDLFRQPGHLLSMPFFIPKAPPYGMNATQSVISQVGKGRPRLSFDLAEPVDQHAFAERPAASAQSLY